MAIKALIFDFDGLIIDTETPELKAWHELFHRYGIDFSFEDYARFIGMVYDDTSALDVLQSRLGIHLDKESLFKEFKQRKIELIDQQPLRSGIRDYLIKARLLGLKIGLASSAKREWIDRYLSKHAIAHYFDCVKTIEDASQPKPHPQLYLLSLECLGIAAKEAIALEDSYNGICAAKAAGLHAVAVPNSVTSAFDFSRADLRLEHLADLSLEEMIGKFYSE